MKCTCRFKMIVCLLLLGTALTTAKSQGTVVALKRDAGLNTAGSIDARFTTATVVTTAVSDAILYSGANDGRWMNSGRLTKAGAGGYLICEFDLSSLPDLAGARINLAQFRLYRVMGNSGTQAAGIVLTHDWTEGTGTADLGSFPGAAGGVSFAHPIGYNTTASRNASNGTTPPLQSWGPASNSFFSMSGDVGPTLNSSPNSAGVGYHVYTVTSHVQAWANGWPNYGWALNHGNWDFRLSEAGATYQPVLFIDYTPGGGSNDSTAPAAVANLATSDPTTNTITINWTAPGDDGGTGTAGRYDIRYATSPIDDSNWVNATQIVGEPAPAAAGTSQSYIVQNLTADTTYYFAMKTYDELWNVSSLSNLASGRTPLPPNPDDPVAPAAINTLAITDTRTTGTTHPLTWTAPGDDYNTGTATAYDLRYSTSTITEANWDSATRYTYGVPAPAVAGTSQGVTVIYLNKDTTYYFAIKTVDEAGNWSPLSNVASHKTSAHHDITAPATITDLAASNPTSNAVTLTWSASGDDAIFGTSAYYDVRYSTVPFTESIWFWTATKVTGEPTPLAYGTSQSMTVTGLNAGTTYYFALRAVDDEMNWSGRASASATTLTATDGTAPAAIGDLVANHPSSGTVRLTWTAPGDDDASGTATTYDIRYSTGTITEENWASARQVTGELAPTVAGTTQTWTVQGLSADTTYTFAIKAIDEAGDASALSNVVSSTTLTTSDLNKPVLTEQDFEYLGAFKLPTSVNGRSTGFSTGGIALRHVNGNLRILTEASQATDSAIYECDFPGWGSTSSAWPQATVIYDWNRALYGSPSMMSTYLAGLLFDAATDRFYFSWGSGYSGNNNASLGWAELIEGAPAAHGPWKDTETMSHKIRGGTTIIPDWFANTYVGSRRLGMGFGGYYSIVAGASRGPFLAAVVPPSDGTTELDTITLINYPATHLCPRDADYYWTPNDPSATDPVEPIGGVGYWTWCDEIFGAGIWIDLPDKHGVIFMPSLGHGHLRYLWAFISMTRSELHRFIYDPKDLAAVAQGSKQAWEPQFQDSIVPLAARASHTTSGGYAGMISGLAFDPQSRTLFAVAPGSYSGGGQEDYPLVHGWRIKETPRKIGDINHDGYVNVGDLQALVAAWGSQKTPPTSNWNPNADLNTDDFVNVGDLQLLVAHWGE